MSSLSSGDRAFQRAAPNSVSQDAKPCGEPPTLPAEPGEDARFESPLRARIGDFELLSELASGGMGVVYKAHQVSLDRIVALKMLQRSRPPTSRVVRRLENEARIVAHLKHPNIVEVYEFGILDNRHFFSMEFIDGPSLSQKIRQGALEPRVAARYVKQVADAIEHAHRQGVLHRDIKPGNILFDANDRPVVTDFGIAKLSEADRSLTVTGQVLGTPSYMPPEQSLAENERLDARSDVYSLGAVLYESITGKPPFRRRNPIDTMIAVRTEDPESPRAIDSRIPHDLETICLKCLEKEPAARYSTAADLACDLERFLADRPIEARPAGWTEHARRWVVRHPSVAASCAVAAAAVVLVIVGLLLLNSTLQQALDETEAARWALRKRLYWSDVQVAGDAWQDRDIAHAAAILEQHVPGPGQTDIRGPEWHFVWTRVHLPRKSVRISDRPLYFVQFSPDGRIIATAGSDAVIQLHDSRDFSTVLTIDSQQIEVNGLAFSPDGQTLASAGDDGTIRFWSVEHGRKVAQIRVVPEYKVFNLLYSPDGRFLLAAGERNELCIFDVQTGELDGLLEGHESTAGVIALSPDGRRMASADRGGTAFVWDVDWPRASIVGRITTPGRFMSLQFAPDGATLLGGTSRGNVRLFGAESGELLSKRSHLDGVMRVAFAPDGSYVVSADQCGTIAMWQIDGPDAAGGLGLPGVATQSWQAHTGRIMCIAISATGDLVSVGEDGQAVAWNHRGVKLDRVLAQADDAIDAAFLSDGVIATLGTDELVFSDCATAKCLNSIDIDLLNPISLAASLDGKTLVTGSDEGKLSVWDVDSKRRVAQINLPHNFNVNRLALSADGSYVAAVNRFYSIDDDLQVWDLGHTRRLQDISSLKCNSACFARYHPWLFASGISDSLQRWDLQRQQLDFEIKAHFSSINAIAVCSHDRLVATASDDRLVKVWDAQTGDLVRTLAGHRREVHSVAFCENGPLVSADVRGRIVFWNVETGQFLYDFQARQHKHDKLLVSAGAGRIAAIGVEGDEERSEQTLRIFDWMSSAH